MILLVIAIAFSAAFPVDRSTGLDSIKTDSGLVSDGPTIIDSIPSPEGLIELSVELVEISLLDDSAVVEISCDTKGRAIGGIDLSIGTDSRLIDIIAVEPGQMQTDNRWTMFNASQNRPVGEEKVWHIVSLARSMSMGDPEASLLWPGKSTIARLILKVRQPLLSSDTLHSIQFYWSRCSDNSLSDSTGTRLMVGHVGEMPIFPTPVPGIDQPTTSQTSGPASDCFNRSPRPPADLISFNGGGLIIRSNIIIPGPSDSVAPADTAAPAAIDDLE